MNEEEQGALGEKVKALSERIDRLEETFTASLKAMGVPMWWWSIMIISLLAVMVFILTDTSAEVANFMNNLIGTFSPQ